MSMLSDKKRISGLVFFFLIILLLSFPWLKDVPQGTVCIIQIFVLSFMNIGLDFSKRKIFSFSKVQLSNQGHEQPVFNRLIKICKSQHLIFTVHTEALFTTVWTAVMKSRVSSF